MRLLIIIVLAMTACSNGLPRESNLEKPRILAIRSSSPTAVTLDTVNVDTDSDGVAESIIAPQTLASIAQTAVDYQVLYHDPLWQEASITWFLSLDFTDPVESISLGEQSVSETIKDNPCMVFVGEGASLTLTGATLLGALGSDLAKCNSDTSLDESDQSPALQAAESESTNAGGAGVAAAIARLPEQLSIPLVVVIETADQRLTGFHGIRIQNVAASRAYLAQNPDEPYTLEERARLVYNRNPVLGTLEVSASDEQIPIDDRNDLPTRKAQQVDSGVQTTKPGGFVRFHQPATDPDNFEFQDPLERGEPGYNLVTAKAYMQRAMRTPIDRFTADFIFDEVDPESDMLEPVFEDLPRGLYFGFYVVVDRKGGADWVAISADVSSNAPAMDLPPGTEWRLLRTGAVLFWQPLSDQDADRITANQVPLDSVAQAVTGAGAFVRGTFMPIPASSDDSEVYGVPFLLESATAVTEVSEVLDINSVLSTPNQKVQLHGSEVTFAVQLLR